MVVVSRVLEKLGSAGTIIAAMGCAACFPALGALAASIGLGFLTRFEGVFINTLLPLFALVALLANAWGWYRHGNHLRGALSVAGPIAVFATLYPLWTYGWSTYLLYGGIAMMFILSVIDLVNPPRRKHAIAEASL